VQDSRLPGSGAAGPESAESDDEVTAELTPAYWAAYRERVAAASAARAGLSAAAGWAQTRLGPHVDRAVELRLFGLTTQVELAAFDDASFHDAMQRARDRGLYSAPRVVTYVINCVTGMAGIASTPARSTRCSDRSARTLRAAPC
jgi:hypothetical protein